MFYIGPALMVAWAPLFEWYSVYKLNFWFAETYKESYNSVSDFESIHLLLFVVCTETLQCFCQAFLCEVCREQWVNRS